MKYMLSIVSCLLIGICVTSCVPESKNPLSSQDRAQYDKRLIGTWFEISAEGDEGAWLHFIEAEDSMTDMVLVDAKKNKGAEVYYYKMYPTTIDNHSYMNLKRYSPDTAEEISGVGYRFTKYKISNDTLQVWLLTKKVGDAIKNGELKGTVEKNSWFESITITDTSDNIVKFLQKANHEEVFALVKVFKRVQIPKLISNYRELQRAIGVLKLENARNRSVSRV